jgi:hypothetical protein
MESVLGSQGFSRGLTAVRHPRLLRDLSAHALTHTRAARGLTPVLALVADAKTSSPTDGFLRVKDIMSFMESWMR